MFNACKISDFEIWCATPWFCFFFFFFCFDDEFLLLVVEEEEEDEERASAFWEMRWDKEDGISLVCWLLDDWELVGGFDDEREEDESILTKHLILSGSW